MSASLVRLLLQQSESGDPAILWGRAAKPYFGGEFDRLLARGVIVEEAPATSWPPCDGCECGTDERPVQSIDGRIVAVCPIDANADAVLDTDDLRGFRIDLAALVRELASASRLGSDPCEVVDGVWHLGSTPSGRAVFIAPSLLRATQSGIIPALRIMARGAAITLAAPDMPSAERRRLAEAGIELVQLSASVGTNGETPFALDLSSFDPARPVNSRLVIRRSARQVKLDGVTPMLSDQTFGLLTLFAERALTDDPFAPAREIEQRIWGTLVHRVSRPARDVVRELRDALAAGASDSASARGLIEVQRNRGWRLTLTASEIDLGE